MGNFVTGAIIGGAIAVGVGIACALGARHYVNPFRNESAVIECRDTYVMRNQIGEWLTENKSLATPNNHPIYVDLNNAKNHLDTRLRELLSQPAVQGYARADRALKMSSLTVGSLGLVPIALGASIKLGRRNPQETEADKLID